MWRAPFPPQQLNNHTCSQKISSPRSAAQGNLGNRVVQLIEMEIQVPNPTWDIPTSDPGTSKHHRALGKPLRDRLQVRREAEAVRANFTFPISSPFSRLGLRRQGV